MLRALFLSILGIASSSGNAIAVDLELYGALLRRHTVQVGDIASTRVDYQALRHSHDWRRLITSLENTQPSELERREEQLAFWINAYNILAIDLVQRNYPVESIRDLGSLFSPVWKRDAGRIGGRSYSLDEIEHEILRPMGDPRIHGAIVCASLSCPPLQRDPYRADTLDVQLDSNIRRWLADPRKGVRLDQATDELHLSRIFEWFAEDFSRFGGVPAFLERYAPRDVADWVIAQGNDLRIQYFDYDWRVNDTKGGQHSHNREDPVLPGLPESSGRRGARQAREAVARVAPDARVEALKVRDNEEAAQLRFLGSPTILVVNGLEIEPEARSRADYAMGCRVYRGSGLEPSEMIEAALADQLTQQQVFCAPSAPPRWGLVSLEQCH